MITLGCFDDGTSNAACQSYLQLVADITRVSLTEVQPGPDRLALQVYKPAAGLTMTVKDVQSALRQIGFFPDGKADGICGYRTQAAIRLFQEYVRSMEGHADMTPDGRFGPVSQGHLQRWLTGGVTSSWAKQAAAAEAAPDTAGEYRDWLALMSLVKVQRAASPTAESTKVNAYNGPTDTRKVDKWDYSTTNDVHLVSVRRRAVSGHFDDVFILLIRGLVFKFQGSTEPGATKDPRGLPFLMPGQHDYHFGWHKRTYLALRPQSQNTGVLVVRTKSTDRYSEADLARGLEPNATINIHWGGLGMGRAVNDWSEGCQVINGSLYINAADQLVSCASFAAVNNGEVASNPNKTRGAFNVLADLVTAFSSNNPNHAVKYTLLMDADLDLAPALREQFKRDCARVVQLG